MKGPPYPGYRSSGVEWLGDVPEHWQATRLKFLLAEALKYGANESAELDDPDLPRYVRITDIDETDGLRDETFRSLPRDVASPYLLREGDMLFARSGATAGKTFLYKAGWGVCAHAGYLIRARMDRRKALPPFVRYFTASTNYWGWLSSVYIQATIQNVSAERYADLWLPVPPIQEQRAIADFLDRETEKLDTLVAKKRALIETLKEKRTALISRTVTRGLPAEAAAKAGFDPHPKLKPSGIDWLGEVPEHWQVSRLKFHLTRIEQGWSPQCENFPADDGEWAVLKVGAVNSARFDPSENKRLPDNESPLAEYEIRTGDLLISRANTRELLGSAALVRDVRPKLLLCDKLYRLAVNQAKLTSEFLLHFLRSLPGHFEFERGATGASDSMQNISQSVVQNLWLAIPPPPEQLAIADYLDRETAKIDRMVAKVEEAIERLQEYRTALITAAVTGKIDVRGTASAAPPART